MSEAKYCDTADVVIRMMVDRLDLTVLSLKILEPESGTGKIIEQLPYLRSWIENYVEFCEIDERRAHTTSENTGAIFRGFDFMDLKVDNTYDRIIAVPPFESLKWQSHVIKMYEHLKESGKMVVLLPTYSLNEENFVLWLSSRCAKIEFISECACSYVCSTYILEIVKSN